HDFASRNHEKQASIQILFGAKRQKEPFYTTPYSSARRVIFTILRSEIVKMTRLAEYNSARSAVKKLFTQPHQKLFLRTAT
ncbi:MAG: hypothetical protein ACOYOO_10370, partial [Saprospiraceae bacterium]